MEVIPELIPEILPEDKNIEYIVDIDIEKGVERIRFTYGTEVERDLDYQAIVQIFRDKNITGFTFKRVDKGKASMVAKKDHKFDYEYVREIQ